MRSSILAALTLTLAACSSSTPTTSGPAQDPGLQGGQQPTGHDVNPYGVAYPSQSIGTSARSINVAGNQIKNFKFLGYPNGDYSKGLQTIALSDYFDPQGKLDPAGASPSGPGIKLIYMSAASVWCGPCNQETDAITMLKSQLQAKGVAFLQALNEGPTPGIGSNPTDLQNWILKHHSTFNEVLDVENANLAPFYNEAAVPWSGQVDARSMEILSDGVGWSGDLAGDVQMNLEWISANPPSYK